MWANLFEAVKTNIDAIEIIVRIVAVLVSGVSAMIAAARLFRGGGDRPGKDRPLRGAAGYFVAAVAGALLYVGVSTGVTWPEFVAVRITEAPPSVIVTDPPTELRRICGVVTGTKRPQRYRIVLYAHTDYWYVQPEPDQLIGVARNGEFCDHTRDGDSYAALVVTPDYAPDRVAPVLPPIGEEVIAVDVVGVLGHDEEDER